MSHGPGHVQRSILTILHEHQDHSLFPAFATDELATRVYGVKEPSEAQLRSVRRAVRGLADSGQVETQLVTLPGYNTADDHRFTIDRLGNRHYPRGQVVSLPGTERLYKIMDKLRPILPEVYDVIKADVALEDQFREALTALGVGPEEAVELINSGRVESVVEAYRSHGG